MAMTFGFQCIGGFGLKARLDRIDHRLAALARDRDDLPGLKIAPGRSPARGIEKGTHLRLIDRLVEEGARGNARFQRLADAFAPSRAHQIEKLVPHPQAAVALGLRIWKLAPISSST